MITVVEASVREEADGMSPIFITIPFGSNIPLMGIVGAFVCKIEVSVIGILFMDLAILAFCFGCARY